MRKIFSDKKGVSPVVSAVIMILVVMITMSALFGFFVNYTRDYQEGSGSAVLESMTVEDVWFKNENTVEIWVYNFGKIGLNITDVYVDGNAVMFTPGNLYIAAGEHGNLTATSILSFERSDENDYVSYNFKIVTARGTSFEGSYIW